MGVLARPEISYSGAEKKAGGGAHGHSHGGGDGSASQMNMRGVFLHVAADALGSVIVIISAIIMWQTEWEYKYYVDPSLSIMLVMLILRSVWPLLIESALILLQTVPTHIQVDSLQQKLMAEVDGILAVHEFHIWQLAGDRIIASAHIRCLNLDQYMQVAEKVKEFFHNEGIHSTTIQPEFVETSEPNSGSISSTEDCMLSCPTPTGPTGCDASKCCPSTGAKTSPDQRRPSSVTIDETGLSSPIRRSAPDLSSLEITSNDSQHNKEDKNTGLSDSHGSSTSNSAKIKSTSRTASPSKSSPPKSSSHGQGRRRSKSPGGKPFITSTSKTPLWDSSGPASMEQDSGEETPMVGTKTKTARVVSKESNVR